jgi:hypothetical protein
MVTFGLTLVATPNVTLLARLRTVNTTRFEDGRSALFEKQLHTIDRTNVMNLVHDMFLSISG